MWLEQVVCEQLLRLRNLWDKAHESGQQRVRGEDAIEDGNIRCITVCRETETQGQDGELRLRDRRLEEVSKTEDTDRYEDIEEANWKTPEIRDGFGLPSKIKGYVLTV